MTSSLSTVQGSALATQALLLFSSFSSLESSTRAATSGDLAADHWNAASQRYAVTARRVLTPGGRPRMPHAGQLGRGVGRRGQALRDCVTSSRYTGWILAAALSVGMFSILDRLVWAGLHLPMLTSLFPDPPCGYRPLPPFSRPPRSFC